MNGRKRERSEHTSHKVIEKRRRDRINSCLAELSQAVPSIFAKQTSGKLEKAEILEMTVKYLRVLQRCGIAGRFETGSETKLKDGKYDVIPNQYNIGYNECLKETIRYLTEVEGLSTSDEKYKQIVQFLLSRQEVAPQLSTNHDYYPRFTSNPVPAHALHVVHSPPIATHPYCFDSRYPSFKVKEMSPPKSQFRPKLPLEIRAPPELIVSDERGSFTHEPSPQFTDDPLTPVRGTPTLWRPFPVSVHTIRHAQRQLFQPHPMCAFDNVKIEEYSKSI